MTQSPPSVHPSAFGSSNIPFGSCNATILEKQQEWALADQRLRAFMLSNGMEPVLVAHLREQILFLEAQWHRAVASKHDEILALASAQGPWAMYVKAAHQIEKTPLPEYFTRAYAVEERTQVDEAAIRASQAASRVTLDKTARAQTDSHVQPSPPSASKLMRCGLLPSTAWSDGEDSGEFAAVYPQEPPTVPKGEWVRTGEDWEAEDEAHI